MCNYETDNARLVQIDSDTFMLQPANEYKGTILSEDKMKHLFGVYIGLLAEEYAGRHDNE